MQAVTAQTPPVVQVHTLTFLVAPTINRTILVGVVSQFPIATVADTSSNPYVIDGVGSVPGGYVTTLRAFVSASAGPFSVLVTQSGTGWMAAAAIEVSGTLLPSKNSAAAGTVQNNFVTTIRPGAVLVPAVEEIAILNLTAVGDRLGDVVQQEEGWIREWQDRDTLPHTAHATVEIMSRVFLFTAPGVPLDPHWLFAAISQQIWLANLVTYFERVEAAFSAAPTAGAAPLAVAFDATASKGYSLGYDWDFGDGTLGSGSTTNHTYNTAGTYTARLTVGNPAMTAATTRTITVGGGVGPVPGAAGSGFGFGGDQGPMVPMVPGLPGFEQSFMYEPTPGTYKDPLIAKFEELEAQAREALALIPAVPSGAALDLLQTAIQQITETLNGLIIGSIISINDAGLWDIITGGQGDREDPVGGQYGDQGDDGNLWETNPRAFAGRRRGLPPAVNSGQPDYDDPIALWVCVQDQNGFPQWFEVEIVRGGVTTG